jgi:peptide methionine sulfoxide reductase msrA/msrB
MSQPVKATALALSLVLGWAGWRGVDVLLSGSPLEGQTAAKGAQAVEPKKVQKTPEEWKKELSPEAFKVMFQCGTEAPFSGAFNDFWEKGTYRCAACGAALFSSEAKYEHGTGWPSFTAPADPQGVVYHDDFSHGMHRVEVRCGSCDAHLGHVFEDGPAPSKKHYCINSVAMAFVPAQALPAKAVATFAAGCFWGVEYKFSQVSGVLETRVGYSGGSVKNPTYEAVCSSVTGHAESVRVTFDPSRTSYEELVRKFFSFHDPTQVNRQGPDFGTQYRSAVFYHDLEQKQTAEKVRDELVRDKKYKKRIATEIRPAAEFYRAEEYHQKYYEKNKRGACAF